MEYVKKILRYLDMFILISVILYLNLGPIAVINGIITYLELSKGLFYLGIVCLVLYVIHKFLYSEKIKIKDVLIILLSIFAYFSYHFSLDKNMSLYGTAGRNEGLLALLAYYSIFLSATMVQIKNQKKIMAILLSIGIFQIVIGTIQYFRITNIFGYDRSLNWSANFSIASGTLGNPNFYSTFILICLLYAYGNLLKSINKMSFIKYLLLTIIFVYGLLIGDTLGCLLTFIALLVITLIGKINKKNIKKCLLTLTFFIVLSILADILTDRRIISGMFKYNSSEIKEIFENGIDDSTGNYRIYIWKQTINHVPKYFWTGIGIDSFSLINNGSYFCAGEDGKYECFDKAHNEYLQLLITEGIFSLLTYLLLIEYIIYKFLKHKSYHNNYKYALFIAFVAYLIQAFLNISVITVAPIFYMIMGFLVTEETKEVLDEK